MQPAQSAMQYNTIDYVQQDDLQLLMYPLFLPLSRFVDQTSNPHCCASEFHYFRAYTRQGPFLRLQPRRRLPHGAVTNTPPIAFGQLDRRTCPCHFPITSQQTQSVCVAI